MDPHTGHNIALLPSSCHVRNVQIFATCVHFKFLVPLMMLKRLSRADFILSRIASFVIENRATSFCSQRLLTTLSDSEPTMALLSLGSGLIHVYKVQQRCEISAPIYLTGKDHVLLTSSSMNWRPWGNALVVFSRLTTVGGAPESIANCKVVVTSDNRDYIVSLSLEQNNVYESRLETWSRAHELMIIRCNDWEISRVQAWPGVIAVSATVFRGLHICIDFTLLSS